MQTFSTVTISDTLSSCFGAAWQRNYPGEARLESLAQDDVVCEIDTTGLQTSLQLTHAWLQEHDHDLAPSLPLAEAGLDCPRCGLTFRHLYTLRRHEMHSHGIVPTAGPTLDIARDSIHGKPVCRHCGDSFISCGRI